MNSNSIHSLVKETLNGMGIRETSVLKLIKLTFLDQTEMESTETDALSPVEAHGFSYITKDEFRTFLYDYVELRELRNRIESFCNVNLKDDFEVLWRRLKFDIAFQVAVTYGLYDMRWSTAPSDNIHDIVHVYFTHWAQEDFTQDDVSDLKAWYYDVFSG